MMLALVLPMLFHALPTDLTSNHLQARDEKVIIWTNANGVNAGKHVYGIYYPIPESLEEDLVNVEHFINGLFNYPYYLKASVEAVADEKDKAITVLSWFMEQYCFNKLLHVPKGNQVKCQISVEPGRLVSISIKSTTSSDVKRGHLNMNALSKLDALEILEISNLQEFKGVSLPENFGDLAPKSIRVLTFYHLSMIGSLPTSISRLGGLVELNLAKNMFSGSIPTEFGILRQLKTLDLSSAFAGNQGLQKVPEKLWNIPGRIILTDNPSLTGSVRYGRDIGTFEVTNTKIVPSISGKKSFAVEPLTPDQIFPEYNDRILMDEYQSDPEPQKLDMQNTQGKFDIDAINPLSRRKQNSNDGFRSVRGEVGGAVVNVGCGLLGSCIIS